MSSHGSMVNAIIRNDDSRTGKVYTTEYDDTSPVFIYSSNFTEAPQSSFFNDTMHTSNTVGDIMTFP